MITTVVTVLDSSVIPCNVRSSRLSDLELKSSEQDLRILDSDELHRSESRLLNLGKGTKINTPD